MRQQNNYSPPGSALLAHPGGELLTMPRSYEDQGIEDWNAEQDAAEDQQLTGESEQMRRDRRAELLAEIRNESLDNYFNHRNAADPKA
jgi:hypothetical protein